MVTTDPILPNSAVIQNTEGCTKIPTTSYIHEITTGEARRHAHDTHLQLRMVNHKQDIHTTQPAPLLIFALGRPEQEFKQWR